MFCDDTPAISTSNNCVIQNVITQLNEYFLGTLTTFDLPLLPQGTTFQKIVWDELVKIPYGKTTSYLKIAQQINNVKAIRAVGTSNGKNPIAIVIPCHRVIGTNGTLTGYAGGLWRKKWLLEHEHKSVSKTQQTMLQL